MILKKSYRREHNSSKSLVQLKYLFLFLLSFSFFISNAQQYFPLERGIESSFNSIFFQKIDDFHSNIKPFMEGVASSGCHQNIDSIKSSIKVSPVVNFGGGFEMNPKSQFFTNLAIGVGLRGDLKLKSKKLFYNLTYLESYSQYSYYIQNYIGQTSVVPGQSYAFKNKNDFYSNRYVDGYLSYSPNEIFNFQLGQGKHFFGDGYRSLLLSDASRNYPYLKISTNIWKFRYINLFTQFKDITQGLSNAQNKYGTFHYLSMNLNKSINISLFESIIWGGRDTLNERNFDVNYLNPIIFYRPVEFSTGSADNSTLGMSTRIKLTNKFMLYGQVVLDEFLLDSLRARTGWWANKHGVQGGFKWLNPFGIDDISITVEHNYMRPYTYTHLRPLENYGHFNQPLAHPAGANFKELVSILKYQRNRLSIEAKSVYLNYGADNDTSNYGSNIFLPYTTVESINGNFVGQGIKTHLLHNQIRGAWLLKPEWNLKAELSVTYRYKKSIVQTEKNIIIQLGIKTALNNFYDDFF